MEGGREGRGDGCGGGLRGGVTQGSGGRRSTPLWPGSHYIGVGIDWRVM